MFNFQRLKTILEGMNAGSGWQNYPYQITILAGGVFMADGDNTAIFRIDTARGFERLADIEKQLGITRDEPDETGNVFVFLFHDLHAHGYTRDWPTPADLQAVKLGTLEIVCIDALRNVWAIECSDGSGGQVKPPHRLAMLRQDENGKPIAPRHWPAEGRTNASADN